MVRSGSRALSTRRTLSPSLLRSIRRIALALAIVFAAAAGLLWLMQERLVFVPPPTPVQQGWGATRIDFVSTDGQPLFGFLIVAPAARSSDVPNQLILHFHGNGDLADSWIDWARDVAEHTGWSVFLAEYRGYGGLPGRPTHDGLMRDARAALALVHTQYGLPPRDVVLYGHSLAHLGLPPEERPPGATPTVKREMEHGSGF